LLNSLEQRGANALPLQVRFDGELAHAGDSRLIEPRHPRPAAGIGVRDGPDYPFVHRRDETDAFRDARSCHLLGLMRGQIPQSHIEETLVGSMKQTGQIRDRIIR
jgi:hypothetical protein